MSVPKFINIELSPISYFIVWFEVNTFWLENLSATQGVLPTFTIWRGTNQPWGVKSVIFYIKFISSYKICKKIICSGGTCPDMSPLTPLRAHGCTTLIYSNDCDIQFPKFKKSTFWIIKYKSWGKKLNFPYLRSILYFIYFPDILFKSMGINYKYLVSKI